MYIFVVFVQFLYSFYTVLYGFIWFYIYLSMYSKDELLLSC